MKTRKPAVVLTSVSAAALVCRAFRDLRRTSGPNQPARKARLARPPSLRPPAISPKTAICLSARTDFTRISEDDYIPAFEQGMAIQKAEVAAIIANAQAPSFENTIVAPGKKSGRMLGRVERVFYALTGGPTPPTGSIAIDTEISPQSFPPIRNSINLDPGAICAGEDGL